MDDKRVYGYIYTFVVDNMTESKKKNLYGMLDRKNIDGLYFTNGKSTRIITIGSTRRKVENLMFELKGKHLRILDDFTFGIMHDYICTRKRDGI